MEKIKPESLDKVTVSNLRNLIEWCISHEAEDRPTIEQILEYRFFLDTSINDNYISYSIIYAPEDKEYRKTIEHKMTQELGCEETDVVSENNETET